MGPKQSEQVGTGCNADRGKKKNQPATGYAEALEHALEGAARCDDEFAAPAVVRPYSEQRGPAGSTRTSAGTEALPHWRAGVRAAPRAGSRSGAEDTREASGYATTGLMLTLNGQAHRALRAGGDIFTAHRAIGGTGLVADQAPGPAAHPSRAARGRQIRWEKALSVLTRIHGV